MKKNYKATFLCFAVLTLLCICNINANVIESTSTSKILNSPPGVCNTSPVISCPANYYS